MLHPVKVELNELLAPYLESDRRIELEIYLDPPQGCAYTAKRLGGGEAARELRQIPE